MNDTQQPNIACAQPDREVKGGHAPIANRYLVNP